MIAHRRLLDIVSERGRSGSLSLNLCSVYRDPAINKLSSAQRKTVVDHWGRFQLTEQLRAAKLPAAG